MTMSSFRLCILGDSHVAAVKRGFDLISSDYPGVDVKYFAKPSDSLLDLVSKSGVLTMRKKEQRAFMMDNFGYSEIDPSSFDGFLCVGMCPSVHEFVKFQKSHKLSFQSSTAPQYVSEYAYLAAFDDVFDSSVLRHVCQKLSEIVRKPTLVTLNPRRSESVLELHGDVAQSYKEIIAQGDGQKISDLLERAIKRNLPEGMLYLPPPPQTLLQGILTRNTYSDGSFRLGSNREHDKRDRKHMNEKYGMEIARAAIERFLRIIPDFANTKET